jgi:hypothetical protein
MFRCITPFAVEEAPIDFVPKCAGVNKEKIRIAGNCIHLQSSGFRFETEVRIST